MALRRPACLVAMGMAFACSGSTAQGLPLFITVDVTNGLDRAKEDPYLDSIGSSITDTAIQHR